MGVNQEPLRRGCLRLFPSSALTAFNTFHARISPSRSAWDDFFAIVKDGTQRTEQALDRTITTCNASNTYMAQLDKGWKKPDMSR